MEVHLSAQQALAAPNSPQTGPGACPDTQSLTVERGDMVTIIRDRQGHDGQLCVVLNTVSRRRGR